jgi:uncharacterized Zn-binding protein involved in type VI secretion
VDNAEKAIMRTIGWIRKDDVAACGAIVVEGVEFVKSMGKPIALVGARMSCAKNCVIAEGYSNSKVNGVPKVLHGMKTTGGCPLISTLNDRDGVVNSSGAEVPSRFVLENGKWIGKTNEGFDQHFVLTDEVTGEPLAHRNYRIECGGKTVEGRTDVDGKTAKIETNDPANAKITIMPEGV